MPEIARLAERVIRAHGPALRTERKWGAPWFVGRDLVCVVGAFTDHVGVEFWRGTSLSDPRGPLEGSGKNLRHAKLRTAEENQSEAFAALIRAAIRLDAESEKRPR